MSTVVPEPQPRWPHSPEFGPIATFIEGVYGGSPWLTHVTSAVDWLGNRFAVGEQVMYCISAGRSQVMAVGTVQCIRAREAFSYTLDGTTRARLPAGWEMQIQVLTEKTSGGWDNKKRTRAAWVNAINVTALAVVAR